MSYTLTGNAKEVDRSNLLNEVLYSLKHSGQIANIRLEEQESPGILFTVAGDIGDDYDIYSYAMDRLLDMVYENNAPHTCSVAFHAKLAPNQVAIFFDDDSIDPEYVLEQITDRFNELHVTASQMQKGQHSSHSAAQYLS